MPSNALAAFAAGLFVATLVLTHDASAGDELLVARGLLLPSPSPDVEVGASRNDSAPDPYVVEGRASDAPEGTKTPNPDVEAMDFARATDPTDPTDPTDATDATDATDDRPVGVLDAPASRAPVSPDPSPMTTREAFAAAMATTRLALRLWARAGRPATDALEWYTRAGSKEFLAYLWRVGQIVSETSTRVKALVVAGFAALVAARAAALALLRHLRRARYRARAREALARLVGRVARARDRGAAPFVAAARRVASVARTARRRYAAFIADVKTKSRLAALLAPHVIVLGAGGATVAALPHWARAFVRKREVVASATLLVPTFCTVNALEKCRASGVDGWNASRAGAGARADATARRDGFAGTGSGLGAARAGRADAPPSGRKSLQSLRPSASLESLEGLDEGLEGLGAPPDRAGGEGDARAAAQNAADPAHARLAAEAWLRFWSSAAPVMFLLDLPFVATGVHVMVPCWPELTLLWTAWLTFPMTAGARLVTDLAAPRVAGWAAGAGAGAGGVGVASDARAAKRGARSSFFFPIRRVRRVLDRSAHRSLRVVAHGLGVLGFKRAGSALGLALDNASLPMIGCATFFFTPTFLTLYGCATAALALPAAASLDALATKNHADGTPRGSLERSKRICSLLRYWLAYSMLWSLARELSRGALSWFPLWRHAELALVFWLAVFGGADEVTARVFAAKQGIVSEHHKAAARARVAKEAARLERGSGSRDSLRSAGSLRGSTLSENESRDSGSDGEPERAAFDAPVAEAAGARESRGAFADFGVSEANLRRRVNAAAGSRK